MNNSATVLAPHSILLLGDPEKSDVPMTMGTELISWTSSCVVVGCRPDSEGETTITLGSSADIEKTFTCVFDNSIATPARKIVVFTALMESLLEKAVPTATTRLVIWVNDTGEPDQIVVELK
jgi:hypothetical protein